MPVCLHWGPLVLRQLFHRTELLPGSANDAAAAVLFGYVCLEGSGYTMADYLTLRTMDESYKLTIT